MSLVSQVTSVISIISAAIKSDRSRITTLENNILKKNHTQTFPLLALGGTYSFDVAVTGAAADMIAVVNPTSSLGLGTVLEAVCGANKVTISVKAGVIIAAGDKSFNIRVIK